MTGKPRRLNGAAQGTGKLVAGNALLGGTQQIGNLKPAALRCSEAAFRQARLAEGANAHRNPPEGWEAPLARLARQKADHF